MNIFVLDSNIENCARAHGDKHVIKMVLESAQMLCTVLHITGVDAPYKKTHINHPCTKWAAESIENWMWLKEFALKLNDEYKFRYGKIVDHKSAVVVKSLPTPDLPSKGLTAFAKAMPTNFQSITDPIEAYRTYYMHDKRHLAKWTNRQTPDWWK